MTNTPPDYDPMPSRPSETQEFAPDEPGTSAASSAAWPPQDTTSAADSSSTKAVAKDEAANVKDTAVDAGKNVAATAKDEAANVAGEAKQQATSLLGSVTSEVQSQAGSQQQKIASSVHAFSQELQGMASGSSESGPLTDLAQQAAQKGGEIADWLENREPRDVLREVESFGRRRPVMFLALCGLAGVVAGRLTRGAVAANTSIDSPSTDRRDTGQTETRALQTAPASMVDELPPTYEVPSTYETSRDADQGYASLPAQGAPLVTDPLDPYRPGEVR